MAHRHASGSGLKSKPEPDALSVALDAVADRWSLHIVRAVAFGASRFTDILGEVGAPRDVLSSRLKQLTEAEILKPAEPGRGRYAGYALTDKGRDLGQVILVLKRWGDTYGSDEVATTNFIHQACGDTFVAEVVCRSCGRPVGPAGLSLEAADPGATSSDLDPRREGNHGSHPGDRLG